ncbi:MAG: succinyl-diaminopimelate desuccinylase [Rhodospirillales bacterium]|nr:succinyl-diaminopimelate desuccinylase [Rhodospirillales bacterium]
MTKPIDPIELTRLLIQRPSVTPADAGALGVLEKALSEMGFVCERMPYSEEGTPDVDNLYARLGTEGPNICFAGHTDVVPPGDINDWQFDPFAAHVENDMVYGRGAVDMKAAIACFAAAVSKFKLERDGRLGGSISFLITGDEEGPAINGTLKMLKDLDARGEKIDCCIVGEPTNPDKLGDMIKIGRRGSLNGHLTVTGIQGHVAYPQLADNPVPRMISMLNQLTSNLLDNGSEFFQPSTLEVTTVDVGNPTTNLIPGAIEARFNVRFNDHHTGDEVIHWIKEKLNSVSTDYFLDVRISGESFLTPPGKLSVALVEAVEKVTKLTPVLDTTGGTSDARFIKDYCEVAEFGMINQTAHKVDERVSVVDIRNLTEIYKHTLERLLP